MVDWSAPQVLRISDYVFSELSVFLLGVYSWHFVITLHHVELPLLCRRINFHWAYVPYMVARLSAISFLLSLVIISQAHAFGPNCPRGLKGLSLLGNLAAAGASTNLFVRTFALWKHRPWFRAILATLSAGQWILSLATSIWNVTNGLTTCSDPNSVSTVREILMFYVYTVTFDFIILIATCIPLWNMSPSIRHSYIWVALFHQGICYFVTTLAVSLVVLIFAGLDLNPVLNILFTVPAITISVIASSRAVISFQTLHEDQTAHPSHPTHNTVATTVSIGNLTTNVELAPSMYDEPLDSDTRQMHQKAALLSTLPTAHTDRRSSRTTRPGSIMLSLVDLEAGSSQASAISGT